MARRSRALGSPRSAPWGSAAAPLATPGPAPGLFVVIVDDELLARRRLRRHLAEEQGISRVAECACARTAAAIVDRERPDVVFIDAALPGAGGLGEITGGGASVPVLVEVVADARRVRKGGDRRGYHLLKPVAREPLRAILDRVRHRLATPAVAGGDGGSGHGVADRLVIRSAGRILALPLEALDWIEAADNYVLLHRGERIHLVRGTLADFEIRLGEQRFVRIHRCAIVNIEAVEEVHSLRGTWQLRLRSGATVPVGRTHRSTVRVRLGR